MMAACTCNDELYDLALIWTHYMILPLYGHIMDALPHYMTLTHLHNLM